MEGEHTCLLKGLLGSMSEDAVGVCESQFLQQATP